MNEQQALEAALQCRAQVMQHYAMAPQVFLDAWKEGVRIAGASLFKAEPGYIYPSVIGDACDKWQLIPDLASIHKHIGYCSVGEGVFLGSLVSFYNSHIGEEILEQFGNRGLGNIANRLELDQLQVLTTLMLNHTGW